jgi:ubiquinone/menaquinone biosynthesis C-methylase UbiE
MKDRRGREDPVVAEYAAEAAAYDRKWAFYIEATTRETLVRMPLRGDERVLDVGCGTGELLSSIAERHSRAKLAGIDPVAEMLAVAAKKLAGRNADLRVGWADELPWPNASFDLVVSCNVFHYISHPGPALRQMTRVLAPGGRIVITDWCDDYLACRLCSLYLHWTGAAFYKIYSARECEDLLQAAGHDVRIERYKISWLWGLMTVTAARS